MNLSESVLGLFGLQIKQKDQNKNLSGALSVNQDDDGSSITSSVGSLGNAFGTYLDIDGTVQTEIEAIRKYREISLFAEVDVAIQEIVNEAIPQEQDTKMIKLDLDDVEELSDGIKKKIQEEFNEVLRLLNYDEYSAELFRKWYVDGRLPFQIIVNKDKLTDGIQKMILLNAQNVRKVKEITTKKTPEGADVIEKIDEYYLYTDTVMGGKAGRASGTNALKISKDAIVFVTSGIVDNNSGMVLSHLNKAIRPINQLRMLEDATVVYFIARAPERRVFYVDVGNLPKLKAEQYLKDIMNRYRNKMVYDAKTGDVKNDKKYMSMLEDFWMPRRDGGKGTEITSLPGAGNITGYLDSLSWFKEKMYESLNIPKSRLQSENGFSMGRSTEISRDEVKFQKFVDKLRNKFGQLILDTLRIQLILKGICNNEEWEDIKPLIKFDFQRDNFFSELKNQEVLQSRIAMLQQVDNYLQKYVSKEWIQRNVLMMTDDDIDDMDKQLEAEKDDPTAAPDWKIQAQFQMDQQQEMLTQQQPPPGMSGQPQPGMPGQSAQASPSEEPEYDPSQYNLK